MVPRNGTTDQSRGVRRVRHFLMELADRHPVAASGELSEGSSYYVPGSSWIAGNFSGRDAIVGHLQQMFDFASRTDALRWIDWMSGTDHVSVLVDVHLGRGLSEFDGALLFLFSFNPSGDISEIRLFLEDQERFDLFFGRNDGAHDVFFGQTDD